MNRLTRWGLLLVTAALFAASAAPAAAAATTLAPPFTSKNVITTPGGTNSSETGSADTTTGAVAADAGAATPMTQAATSSADVKDRLYTSWTASFTGTALFTATFQLTGNVTAQPQGFTGVIDTTQTAQATAVVKGTIQVFHGKTVKTKSAQFASVSAICTAVCKNQQTLPFQGLKPQLQVSMSVQQGVTYTVLSVVRATATANVGLPGTGEASGQACVASSGSVCNGNTVTPPSAVSSVTMRQK